MKKRANLESEASVLTELNVLKLGRDGVFHDSEYKEFAYSDGAAAEQSLYRILSEASDLSSDSDELDSLIFDWPTEYHLSSRRANLLRGLDLTGITNVLELGCGCGAISRYLGEQDGVNVDAVEGSAIRASLAALRCSDLPNVTISSGNFNVMQLPEGHYDLVLFVGVTEYAGRFSEGKDDQRALQDLLALAKRSIKKDGMVLVAIENRLGLKYLMGACEDHYGVPYVGVDNYFESTGIRTYSRDEWQQQINEAGFAEAAFSYPFPDYKVPSLLINESNQLANSKLTAALANIKSRDYNQPFDLADKEARLWQGVVEAGTLAEFSNSYLMLLGHNQQRLQQAMSFDLLEFPHRIEPAAEPEARTPSDEEQLQRLSEQLVLKEAQVDHLKSKIGLIVQSKGWRGLNKIRSIFGKSVIDK